MLLFLNLSPETKSQSSYPKLNTEQLEAQLKGIAAADSVAFEALYCSTAQTLYAYILSILGNYHDTQDILQDTYLKIRAGAHLYQAQGKPLAWMFTIAKNLAYMQLRAAASKPTCPLEDQTDEPLLAAISDPEDRLILQEALEILSTEERQIVLLHAVSGLKHREIATGLGFPLSTVLSKYVRGLGKLKKRLVKMGVTL